MRPERRSAGCQRTGEVWERRPCEELSGRVYLLSPVVPERGLFIQAFWRGYCGQVGCQVLGTQRRQGNPPVKPAVITQRSMQSLLEGRSAENSKRIYAGGPGCAGGENTGCAAGREGALEKHLN